MENIKYHRVVPENNSSAGFTEFDTIDWLLVADGRKLMRNSIRVEADVEVFKTGTTRKTAGNDLRVSNLIGAHAFFESWTCETQSAGVLQNLQGYPRYQNMIASATLDADDLCDAGMQAELRNPSAHGVGACLEEIVAYNDNASNAVLRDDASMSIKPNFCWNNMTGDYSFSKNGYIRVSCNLARNNHALYGREADADCSYKLKNVVIKFVSVPDNGQQEKLLMKSYVNIKSTVQSTDSHIQARVPSKAVSGVTISFLKQDDENNNNQVDSNALQSFKQLDEIIYLFNNSQSNGVTYPLSDKGDMLKKALESVQDATHNQGTGNKLAGNKGYLLGLDFAEMVDLSNQRFSIQMKSADASLSTSPMNAYLYFHELLSM